MSKVGYYIYRVKDDAGRDLYGVLEGLDKKDIQRNLANSKYYFVSATAIKKEALFAKKVKFETLIMFTHRLTSLVEAGIPILMAMEILWRQSEDHSIQIVVSYLKKQLEEGNRISTSMDAFPNAFPVVYRSLIRVGELGGALVTVLRKLSSYLDYKAQMVMRTKKAMLYPMIVLSFSLLVILGMFIFVVPTFARLLVRLRVELPVMTKMILHFSELIRSPWFLITLAVSAAALFVVYRQFRKRKDFSRLVDNFKIKIPYFGNLILILSLSQFIRSLSILLSAGVPVVESITVATTTTGNKKIITNLEGVRSDIEQGASLYESFRKIAYFPVLLIEMIGVGESSGKIVQVLEKVTNHFDEEVDYQLNRFLTYLEPALIITVGCVVCITLLSIYLPITTIWQGILK